MKTQVLSESQRASLTGLVMAHQAKIRAFLSRYTGDPDVLDELSQDVFISIVDSCEELAQRDEAAAGAYLRGVAKNLLHMRWRKQKRETAHRREWVQRAVEGEWADSLDEEAGRSTEMLDAIESCMEKIEGPAKSMMDRHFFEGIPLTQMARETGKSREAIRMVMLRIRRRLKLCVQTAMEETPGD